MILSTIGTGILARSKNFYDWEARGRGWQEHTAPVRLEPPFRPFERPRGSKATRRLDDGRRPTWLSRFIELLRGGVAIPSEVEADTRDEPHPLQDLGTAALHAWTLLCPEGGKLTAPMQHGLVEALGSTRGPLSFELVGVEGMVSLRLVSREGDTELVQSVFGNQLPGVELRRCAIGEGLPAEGAADIVLVELGLAHEFMLPIRKPADLNLDPLLGLLTPLTRARMGECATVQILFESTVAPWAESVQRAVLTPSGRPFFADAPELTKQALEKVKERLFAVVLRIVVGAPSDDRAWELAEAVLAGFRPLADPMGNMLVPMASSDPGLLLEDIRARRSRRSGMLLSLDELGSLVRLPGADIRVPALLRTGRSKPPREVLRDGLLIGTSRRQGAEWEIRLPDEARLKHVHVVGASGTGKSTLLESMLLGDIQAGRGVGLVDPHGDLVDAVLSRIPRDRVEDVVLLDPTEEEFVLGWNMLGASSDVERDLLASDLVGVFKRLSTSWGDQMTAVLANAVLAVLHSPRGGTIEDLRQLLLDPSFRSSYVPTVTDEFVRSFWETEYPLIAGKRPQGPILTRLNTFLRSRLVRRIVTERHSVINFSQVIGGGKIFLAKLAQGAIGRENAALLGALLVSKIHQVTMARQGQDPDARRPFFLYLDEFHEVATPSMAALFSGVRKYALGLTVGHQNLSQLKRTLPELKDSLMGNAYTRIIFRVGDDDARELAPGFGNFKEDDFALLEIGEAICRVGPKNADFVISTKPSRPLDAEVARAVREGVRRASFERHGRRAVQEPRMQSKPPEVSPSPPKSAPIPPARSPHQVEKRSQVQELQPPVRAGTGGPEHTYLQELVKSWAADHGFKAVVEHELPGGGRVDIALSRADLSVAVEIAVTTSAGHELQNLAKCLKAGFDHVVTVSLNEKLLKALGARVAEEFAEEERSRIVLLSPPEFLAFLGALPGAEDENTVAGYRVKVKYGGAGPDAASRKKAMAEIVLRSVERLRKG